MSTKNVIQPEKAKINGAYKTIYTPKATSQVYQFGQQKSQDLSDKKKFFFPSLKSNIKP